MKFNWNEQKTIATFEHKNATGKVFRIGDQHKLYIEGQNVRNRKQPECKLITVGYFKSEKSIERWLGSYSYDPKNKKPVAGDVVEFKPGQWYTFNYSGGADGKTPKGGIGRIEGIGRWKADEYHICANLGSAHHDLKGNCSISGGPFCSLEEEELEPTDRTMEIQFWNWGTNGPGADQGVYFTKKVRVWECSSKKEL